MARSLPYLTCAVKGVILLRYVKETGREVFDDWLSIGRAGAPRTPQKATGGYQPFNLSTFQPFNFSTGFAPPFLCDSAALREHPTDDFRLNLPQIPPPLAKSALILL